MTRRGLFISIEGVEGVGKSTNLEYLEALLKNAEVDFVTTREPGGTDLSEKIRQLLLDKQNVDMTDKAELMLVFAARAQHVTEFIEPHIAKGYWVISDRFTDSTYAYQGGGRQMPMALIDELDAFAIDRYQPDLTLLLDLPTEVGLTRAQRRGELDRFESESGSFFHRVRTAFLARAKSDPDRFRVIDASQDLQTVQERIAKMLAPLIAEWSNQ